MIRRSKDTPDANDPHAVARQRMVDRQIRARGITDGRVLDVFTRVPRHEFVLPADARDAYKDHPLPIGNGQTISQPYIVALMTESLDIKATDRVLEVGLGSGYQTAILAELAGDVFSLEVVKSLAEVAGRRLEALGYTNIHLAVRDGYKGWPEEAPFNAIVVTAAPDSVPQTLVDQLADPGRMVIPVGRNTQELVLLEKRQGKVHSQKIADVRFVPMVEGGSSGKD